MTHHATSNNGRESVPLDINRAAAGASSELSVAWEGHAPGGRPQLTRKSEFGAFDTSARSLPSGRAR
jgi:hypothetical protein